MRIGRLAAAVAVAAAFAAAPSAHAYGGLGCGMWAMQDDAFGQPAFGWMSGGPFTDTGSVAIRCYLVIDGVEQPAASTPTGSGTGVATTQGMIGFGETSLSSHYDVCAEVTVPAGTQHHCTQVVPIPLGTTTWWILPQPVI